MIISILTVCSNTEIGHDIFPTLEHRKCYKCISYDMCIMIYAIFGTTRYKYVAYTRNMYYTLI